MSEQQQEVKQTQKKRRSKKEQKPKEIIDVSGMNAQSLEYLKEVQKSLFHKQKQKQNDVRYARRLRVEDHIVQMIADNLRQQNAEMKPDTKPKLWIRIKNMLISLQITSREVAISTAETAKAVQDVDSSIDPDMESKPLNKIADRIRSTFDTCTKNGYEIHSFPDNNGIERYFLFRNKEDFDEYEGRLGQRIDNRFNGLDKFVERRDKILSEQKEEELVEVEA